MDKEKISIIITFYKNENILYQCLYNLKESLNEKNKYEIILINDNPNFCIANDKEITKFFPNIITIDNAVNLGYAGACNAAVKLATGSIIVLMDCDIMITRFCIEEMLSLYRTNPNIGGISPVIINMEDNTILHYGFATNKIDMIKPYFCRPVSDLSKKLFGVNLEFPVLTSGCCLFDKALYKKVGGMNELLYNGYCDIDLFYKFYKAGYKNYLCSKTRVYHRGCVSGQVRTAVKTDAKALFCSIWGKYYYKEGLKILKDIYKSQLKQCENKYILFNFSNSILSADYIDIIRNLINLEYVYKCNTFMPGSVILEDHISLSLQHSKFHFIYFCDDYRDLVKNYFWFNGRKATEDLIMDRNGNVVYCNKSK